MLSALERLQQRAEPGNLHCCWACVREKGLCIVKQQWLLSTARVQGVFIHLGFCSWAIHIFLKLYEVNDLYVLEEKVFHFIFPKCVVY